MYIYYIYYLNTIGIIWYESTSSPDCNNLHGLRLRHSTQVSALLLGKPGQGDQPRRQVLGTGDWVYAGTMALCNIYILCICMYTHTYTVYIYMYIYNII